MENYDDSSDFQWIDETLQGNVRSFSNIIKKYQDRIYSFIARLIRNHEDAKDITQNVFIKAFSNLKKFRRESSFLTWLYRIAVNQVKNYWRDKKNRLVIPESDIKIFTEELGNRFREIPDQKNNDHLDETKQLVNNLISFLPLEQKQIFVFYYVIGYTCQEIAEIFKTSPSNIKIQLFRGRQYLYDKFKRMFK